MNNSLTNKIGKTTTTATDTRKNTTPKHRRRFGFTCSQKRTRAKWAKINEARRLNTGLSKSARKAKNKAAEERIIKHKSDVATARRAHRNARNGTVEEKVEVKVKVKEELKPIVDGLFSLLSISSTASNKDLNNELGTFAYEQLVKICNKAMPGPMGLTYTARFNKANFVTTVVFTEAGKTTRKAMLLSKLSDDFVEDQQSILQAEIIRIEQAEIIRIEQAEIIRIEQAEIIRIEQAEMSKKAIGPITMEKRSDSASPSIPSEIDFSTRVPIKMEMMKNNKDEIQKNNTDSDSDSEWEKEYDEEVNNESTNCAWSDVEDEDDGCKSRTTWQATLKRHAKGDIDTDDISNVPSLPKNCGWGLKKSQHVPEKQVVESKQQRMQENKSLPVEIKKLRLELFQTVLDDLDDLDDLESSDDEDDFGTFAHVKPVPKAKTVPKAVPKAKTVPKPVPKAKTVPKPVPKAKTVPKPVPKAKTVPKPVPKAKTVPKPDKKPTLQEQIDERCRITKAKIQKNRRGVDMTAFFFQSQQDTKNEHLVEQSKIRDKRKADAVVNNEKRTAAFEAFKHRGAGGKDAGRNKHTKACHHAIDDQGNWLTKHKCTRGPRCSFAHEGEQLAMGRISLGCLFGEDCRKMTFPSKKSQRCWCVHQVKDGENMRPESGDEYFERTGRNMTDPLKRQRIQISMQKKVQVQQMKPVAKKPNDMMRMRASTSVIVSRKKQAAIVKKQEKHKSAWQSRRSKNVVSGKKIQLEHRINRVLSETPAVKNARKGGNLVIKNTFEPKLMPRQTKIDPCQKREKKLHW
jgi:hypothetical protein